MIIRERYKPIFSEVSHFSRIWDHIQHRNVAVVSPSRSENTKEENNIAGVELRKDLEKSPYGYYRMVGFFIENYKSKTKPEIKVKEPSYFIIGSKEGYDSDRLKQFAIKLGEKYNQDSILYKPFTTDEYRDYIGAPTTLQSDVAYLIGTKENAYPGYLVEKPLGEWHPDRIGEFYTEMKKTPFVFEFIESLSVGSQLGKSICRG